MEACLYHYNALITSVYDGDTCTADIDLGLGICARGDKSRLSRINAPELRGDEREAGLLSRDFLRGKIDGKNVIIKTEKDKKGKYGRYLAEIYITDVDGNSVNINDLLVGKGFAEYMSYRCKRIGKNYPVRIRVIRKRSDLIDKWKIVGLV